MREGRGEELVDADGYIGVGRRGVATMSARGDVLVAHALQLRANRNTDFTNNLLAQRAELRRPIELEGTSNGSHVPLVAAVRGDERAGRRRRADARLPANLEEACLH